MRQKCTGILGWKCEVKTIQDNLFSEKNKQKNSEELLWSIEKRERRLKIYGYEISISIPDNHNKSVTSEKS